jgi:hypothetical protein
MNGNFLFDTQTGKVWIYDSSSKQFVSVKKQTSPLEDLLIVGLLKQTKEKLGQEFTKLSTADKKKFKEVYDKGNIIIDTKISQITSKL